MYACRDSRVSKMAATMALAARAASRVLQALTTEQRNAALVRGLVRLRSSPCTNPVRTRRVRCGRTERRMGGCVCGAAAGGGCAGGERGGHLGGERVGHRGGGGGRHRGGAAQPPQDEGWQASTAGAGCSFPRGHGRAHREAVALHQGACAALPVPDAGACAASAALVLRSSASLTQHAPQSPDIPPVVVATSC